MTDTYANWAALAAANTAGVDYRLESRTPQSAMSHIAIHGGGIEPGTTEVADAVAAATGGRYYSMVAIKPSGNSVLHITSTHFDEPTALAIQASVYQTVSYHGAAGTTPITHLGGADTVLRDRVGRALRAAGFATDIASTELDGNDPANITQRNRRSAGVQLEMSNAQRAAFFPNGDLSRAMRESGQRTAAFQAYTAALAAVLAPQPEDTRLLIYVRDGTLARVGRLDDYVSAQVVPRYNAVGAATVTLSAGAAQAGLMVEGNGLIFTRSGYVLMSGPIRTVDWSRDASDGGPGTLTVGCVDDTTVLAEATCWPDPTSALSAQSDPTYKITSAAAETAMLALVNLNIGPGAQPARRNPLLTLAADGARGGTIAARQVDQFANLLTTLQSIATGAGLGFRVVQVGSSLQFQVFQPVDRSDTARFSFGLGNLTSASYSTTPPTCTVAIVVAGGTDTARVVQSYSQTDPIFPSLTIEQMVDQTSTSTTDADLADQMQQAATEALAQGAGQASLTLAPVDIPLLQYGRDYQVGDTVAVMVRADWYTDVVQQVTLTASASDGPLLTATVGTSDAASTTDAVARIYSYLAKLKKDVARLTSRKAG